MPVLLVALLLVACPAPEDTGSGPDTAPPADTGDTGCFQEVETAIHTVTYDPTDDPGLNWIYEVGLEGWANRVVLEIASGAGASVWQETHDMENVEHDECGTWDSWYLALELVGRSQQEAGESTAFSSSEVGTMTWAVHAYDDDNEQADCVWWGRGEVLDLAGCDEIQI